MWKEPQVHFTIICNLRKDLVKWLSSCNISNYRIWVWLNIKRIRIEHFWSKLLMMCLWCCMWSVMISECPTDHRYITFASLWLLILQADTHFTGTIPVLQTITKCHMLHGFVNNGLFTSKSFMTILINRSNNFPLICKQTIATSLLSN